MSYDSRPKSEPEKKPETPAPEENPISAKLRAMVAEVSTTASKEGRPWALDLIEEADPDAEGQKRVRFVFDLLARTPDEYEKPAGRPAHEFEDARGLAAYLDRHVYAKDAVIFYNAAGVEVVVDEHQATGRHALLRLPFCRTDELKAWEAAIGKKVGHRDLVQTLRRMEHTLGDLEILEQLARVGVNAKLDLDSAVGETAAGYQVKFEAKGNEQLVALPKTFRILIPLMVGDLLDRDAWVALEVRVRVELPSKPEEPLGFVLACPTLPAEWARRCEREIKALEAELPEMAAADEDWLICRGRPVHEERVLGVPKP